VEYILLYKEIETTCIAEEYTTQHIRKSIVIEIIHSYDNTIHHHVYGARGIKNKRAYIK
jgi:hypothetical protein